MKPNIDFFNCKLYDKEAILNWELPEKARKELDLENYDYFFVTAPKESKHEGHKHVHLSIYPTKYDIINLIEVKTSKIEPAVLNKILKSLDNQGFDIITSTGFCNKKGNCYLGVFFSKKNEKEVDIADLNKIKEVKDINIFDYSCDGLCEE